MQIEETQIASRLKQIFYRWKQWRDWNTRPSLPRVPGSVCVSRLRPAESPSDRAHRSARSLCGAAPCSCRTASRTPWWWGDGWFWCGSWHWWTQQSAMSLLNLFSTLSFVSSVLADFFLLPAWLNISENLENSWTILGWEVIAVRLEYVDDSLQLKCFNILIGRNVSVPQEREMLAEAILRTMFPT